MMIRIRSIVPLLFLLVVSAIAQDKPAAAPVSRLTEKQPRKIDVPKEQPPIDALHQLNSAMQSLTARVSPAVVEILVSGFGPVNENQSQASYYARQHSLGSGVILDSSGYIMTNAHVIEGAQRVQVVLAEASRDGGAFPHGPMRTFDAQYVGADRELDLALLKIDATNLPHINLADIRTARQGQLVMAIGSPQGLQNSVTMGVISSIARQPDPDRPSIYIQTDAPINPGNSGGALVDVDGRLLGINTFIYTNGGGSEGLGFAIPAPIVKFAYQSFRKSGRIDRPQIGIYAQSITPVMADALGLRRNWGLVVSDVIPQTPAATSGLQVGDILLTVDDQEVNSLPMLQAALYGHPAEMPADIEILRGDKKLTFAVPVALPKRAIDQLASSTDPQEGMIRQLGAVATTVDANVAKMLGNVRIPSGTLIIARTIIAAAIDSNLRPGDIIHAVDRTPVTTIDDLRNALKTVRPGETVVLQVERDGGLEYMTSEVD